MKFTELKGLAVVDLEDAHKLGDVEDLLLEPATRQVVCLKVKKVGLFSSPILIPVSAVKNIGPNAVTVVVAVASTDAGDVSAAGNAPEMPDPKTLVDLSQTLNNQVVTDGGALIGTIKDVEIDQSTLNIVGYEVSSGNVFTKNPKFAATPDVRYGEKLVTIPQALIEQPEAAS